MSILEIWKMPSHFKKQSFKFSLPLFFPYPKSCAMVFLSCMGSYRPRMLICIQRNRSSYRIVRLPIVFPKVGLIFSFGFYVFFNQSNFFKNCADVVYPIKSIDLAHLEIMVSLKDRFLACSFIKTIPIHNLFDIGIDLVVVFF